MSNLLRPSEVAERLSLSVKTVRTYLAAGKIRGIKTGVGKGGDWRVSEDELLRWMREGPLPAERGGDPAPEQSQPVEHG